MELKRWRQFDFVMVLAVLALVAYGVGMIHSATCSPSCTSFLPPSSWAARQVMYAVAGLGLLVGLTLVDYRVYRGLAYPSFALSLGCLALVLVLGRGHEEWGARRWIQFGFFDFQPSEVTKVAMILALARWLGVDAAERPGLRRVLGSVGFVLAPVVLIYLQPDLGTAIAYVVIWFGMLVAARVRLLYLGGLSLAGLASAPLGWLLLRDYMRQRILTFFATTMDPESDIFGEGYNILQARISIGSGGMFGWGLGLAGLASAPVGWLVLRDYMRQRILTFFATTMDPESDIFGEGYNILQARISIGSGGMFGRGYAQGTQNQFEYLRVKHSDFIFSVLAEEMGFIGAMVLFGLFILLLFRIVRAAEHAPDSFGRLVIFGIGCMLFFQVVVNLGANLTVLPVTGIPLPLVSFGGSALLANFIALGVVQSILVRRLKYRF